MKSVIDVLLHSFELEADQARCVINIVKDSDLEYTPKAGLRTLGALANHLAQIPLIDPSLFVGELDTVEKAQAREKELNRSTVKEMLAVFDEGVVAVKKRFSEVKEKEFFAETLQPFYESGPAKSWANFLPEIITHIAMHKMQIWMYLRLAGAKVDMMTYYGHHSE
jgi:uncharacterized damage-inducible protein DinB